MTTLAQAAREEFCAQTHKPGLCKGQHRGEEEPGTVLPPGADPNRVAQAQQAIAGLADAARRALQVAQQNPRDPKMAQAARRAVIAWRKAANPQRTTLIGEAHKQAIAQRAKSSAQRQAQRDTREQDRLDARAKARAARAAKVRRGRKARGKP